MPAPIDFPKWMQKVDLELVRLRQALGHTFALTGLSVPGPNVTQVDGSLIVGTGEVKSGNYVPATAGWHLGSDGRAEFKDVILYDLPNSMLANPVVPGVASADANGFGLTTTMTEKAGVDATVPSGCTSLLAMVVGRLYAVNTRTSGGADGTGTDAIYAAVRIGSSSSTATPTGVSGSNGFATANAAQAYALSGLTPGSTLRISVYGASGYQTLSAYPDNYISLSAQLVWLR